jgi:hypothetical protein
LKLTRCQIISVSVFLIWLTVAYATLRDLVTGGKKLFKKPTRQVNEIVEKLTESIEQGEKMA